MRSFSLLSAAVLLSLQAFSQANYWQERTSAVGFNVGINPLNPATIYCERTSGLLSVSRDRGSHWTTLPGAPGVSGIRHILVHPSDTLTIFVCEFFNVGLMKTTDEGATWRVVLTGYGIDGESIDYDPVHPDTMYAGKFSDGAVYRSTDRGEHWTLQGISGAHLCGLIVRPDSADILYAGTGASTISKSTDRGVTWRLVNNGGAEEVPKFAINPANPLIGYATTYGEPDSVNNLWKTSDGGEHWFKTALQKIGIWSIAIDVQHPETLYVGRFGDTRGIDRTTDGGASFAHFEEGLLNNFAAWNLRVHPLSPGDVWVAGTENFFGAGGIFAFVPAPPSSVRGRLYFDRNANGLRDTSEAGASGWTVYLAGAATDTAVTDTAGDYAFGPLAPGNFTLSIEHRPGWAGSSPASGSAVLSLNPGMDSAGVDFGIFALPHTVLHPGWNMISLPVVAEETLVGSLFPFAPSGAYSYNKTYLASDTMRHGIGYWLKYGSVDTLLVPGTPSGRDTIAVRQGWNMIGTPSVRVSIGAITSIPAQIVTSQFFGYASSYAIADTLVPSFAYWVRVSAPGRLILAPSAPANAPARIVIVPSAELPPPAPGAEQFPVTALPREFSLEQNYPNPFNPVSTIRYALPVASQVRIVVYSVVGEVVAVLADGIRGAGEYRAAWDAAGRASGVYYCRIEARSLAGETFRAVRKMLLLR